jgi:monoamine oxidase
VDYYRTSFAGEWCALPEEVSLLHYLEYQRGYDGEGEEMDFRFREGLFRLVEGFERELRGHVVLGAPAERVDVGLRGIRVRAGGTDYGADYLVLAVPLTKLGGIEIHGVDTKALAGSVASAENAKVRKILAVYERPFWADRAREGSFATPCGFALMDNSDVAARIHCLAVFLGGPAAEAGLSREQVLVEVAKVVGEEALRPLGYHEQAWLGDRYLCGGYAANRAPTRGPSDAMPLDLGGRIFVAGSEAAREFPSYVEGALFAAEQAATGVARRAAFRASL